MGTVLEIQKNRYAIGRSGTLNVWVGEERIIALSRINGNRHVQERFAVLRTQLIATDGSVPMDNTNTLRVR